jgi:hypothetical protein
MALALDNEVLVAALTGLGAFAARTGLPRSIVDERPVDAAAAERLLAGC